ncbi:alpha/beta hydrolase-fold protein [Rufibacter latericius]|uniref:Alpha/beta hydrolase n=1 Tax=Rufibacter latericius TaxID=2487040 RepID=A0A3M9N2G0_9BACT|nr:alpha/beta hydrolase-fold protein [Rufibacter latericius]RNI31585.1 alpha/beta hydrolase [Rufibacter latericius]
MRAFLFALLLLPTLCFAQAAKQNDNLITIGTKETIHSAILKEDRHLWVYVPKSGDGAKTRYPVMYLLDGDAFFTSMAGTVEYLSGQGKMPEMIIIGIESPDRVRDLTPTYYPFYADGRATNDLKTSGGGANFMAFLEKELMPYIEKRYQTQPYRMLVGHSLGGLTVLQALVHQPALFTSYVAIDPSVWWDKQLIMKQAERVLTQKDYASESLFYAVANTMEKGMDTVRVLQDNTNDNHSVREALQFRETLRKSKNLSWAWKFYPEDNHNSVPLPGQQDALRFLFKKYEMPKELDDSTITVAYVKDHYKAVSAMMQYPVLPSAGTVNALGYISLGKKQYTKAYQFFKLNIDNYPTSSNPYDSMGDYYLEIGDKKKAMEAFRKALSLKEVAETRRKLKQLEAGQ